MILTRQKRQWSLILNIGLTSSSVLLELGLEKNIPGTYKRGVTIKYSDTVDHSISLSFLLTGCCSLVRRFAATSLHSKTRFVCLPPLPLDHHLGATSAHLPSETLTAPWQCNFIPWFIDAVFVISRQTVHSFSGVFVQWFYAQYHSATIFSVVSGVEG